MEQELVRRADDNHRVLELGEEFLGGFSLLGLFGVEQLAVLVHHAHADPRVSGRVGPLRKPVDFDHLIPGEGDARGHGSVGPVEVHVIALDLDVIPVDPVVDPGQLDRHGIVGPDGRRRIEPHPARPSVDRIDERRSRGRVLLTRANVE